VLPSERFPALYPVSVAAHRTVRRLHWLAEGRRPSARDMGLPTPFTIAQHSSVIYRRLADVDMRLQENKRHNLELAIATMDGCLLNPGEELSFWRCIGAPTARRGYLPGLTLENGHMSEGEGGGLCQLSNLLHWLVLHTPLEVTERHHHGYDIFPDSGRVLPFGSGATVFYNYVDLRVRNPSDQPVRLNLWLTADELHGRLSTLRMPDLAYHVHEEGHRFFEVGGRWFRENRLYRVAIDRHSGDEVECRLVASNRCPVMYPVADPAGLQEPAAIR
jgi:vancomycin resistance protein VanW